MVFFFLLVVVMVRMAMAAAATAARRFNLFRFFRMTAAAATHSFRLAFTQQGFNQCQHVVSFGSINVFCDPPITRWRSCY